jgi:hypothetical protein
MLISVCKRPDIDHPCDPSASSYITNSILIQVFAIQSNSCYPPYSPPPTPKLRTSLWGFFLLGGGTSNIRDVKILENKAYVIGLYDYVGPNTGPMAMLNGENLNLLSENSCPYFEIDGTVNQIIDDGNDNAIVAGNFNYIQGIKRKAIAKIKSNCTVDTTFNANMADTSAEVRSMVMLNGRLYIGGIFTGTFASTGSDTRSNLAVISPTTGALQTDWVANVTGSDVNVLKTDGTSLFVGGGFSQIGVTSVTNLAKIDTNTGSTVSILGEPDGTIHAILLSAGGIYVGGNFNAIDGNSSNYVAKVNGSGTLIWSNSNLDSNVFGLSLSNNKLYVIGSFSNPRSALITLDPSTGNDLLLNFQITTGGITGLRELDGKIFLFGSFTSILGKEQAYITAINPSDDTIVSWDARIAAPNIQERGDIFKFSNGNVLIGASFPTLQGVKRTYLSEIDLTTGKPTDWSPTFTFPGGVDVIQALYLKQSRLYLGGSFTEVNGLTRNRFASFDLLPKPTLNNFTASFSGYTNSVSKIAEMNGNIIVSGGYDTVNGSTQKHIVALNATSAQPSYTFAPNTNFAINEFLKLSNGKYVIAGDFNLINGATAINRFAVVNEDSGTLVQFPSGSSIGAIYRILESNGKLVVGFDNNAAPSGTGCCIGFYDTSTLTPISHSLGITPAAGGKVNDLFISGNDLFLMGNITGVKGELKSHFASVSLDTLQLTEFSPVFSSEVYKVTETTTDYYFAGRFINVNGRRRNLLARIRKTDKSLTE